MKLTDYVADFLAREGLRHVFGLTGGAVVHLFDSVAGHPRLTPVFVHHEQTAAFAAQAYARINKNLGAAFVTTGPGGTNALTGVAAAWLDSIPCLYISGQTRFEHTLRGKPVRQLGSQELDIVSIVKSLTKFAVMVDQPQKIKFYLQKASYLARQGRPGPVWIDIPLNFQWAEVDPKSLEEFVPPPENLVTQKFFKIPDSFFEMLSSCQRPLIVAGHGIRLAKAEKLLLKVMNAGGIPVVATWNAGDLIPATHPMNLGRLGILGQRGANLAVQNCDLLISLGSHLAIPLTGTQFSTFARGAKIVMVDIDPEQFSCPTVRVDLPLAMDAGVFLREVLKKITSVNTKTFQPWQKKCRGYLRYNAIPAAWSRQKKKVNPYVFLEILSRQLKPTDVIVVDGGGTITQMAFQTLRFKKGQRAIIDAGLCAMGSGLPQSIGACFAHGRRQTICLCGDGSLQLNIQELETIRYHRLPIKIFVMNNDGYLSIRHTQGGFLKGRYLGSAAAGGVSVPDYQKIARAYGLKVRKMVTHQDLAAKIKAVLKEPGAVLCEVMIARDQDAVPRQGFAPQPDGTFRARPLEDMYPFLPREELLEQMLIPLKDF